MIIMVFTENKSVILLDGVFMKIVFLSRLDFPHALRFLFLRSSRPRSLAEAEGIPGIGVVKLHAVVQKFLDTISKREKSEDF